VVGRHDHEAPVAGDQPPAGARREHRGNILRAAMTDRPEPGEFFLAEN
jgi:hypothetical protein